MRKHVSTRLEPAGFARTKPTFWTRGDDLLVHFVHLHLFTHAPSFRVHLGVRVLSDTFPSPALNGPMSYDGWALGARKYVFSFSDAPDSVARCGDELSDFVLDVGAPWFERFASPESLLAPGGPLEAEAQRRLELALEGQVDEAAIAGSRAMLGLAG